jgi:hypothetical protein
MALLFNMNNVFKKCWNQPGAGQTKSGKQNSWLRFKSMCPPGNYLLSLKRFVRSAWEKNCGRLQADAQTDRFCTLQMKVVQTVNTEQSKY